MNPEEHPEYQRMLKELKAAMNGENGRFPIPDYMHEPVTGYVMQGGYIGDFLKAVFANNLMRSIGAADLENQRHILGYGQMLYTIPMDAYGSPEKVKAWQNLGGMVGVIKKAEARTEEKATGPDDDL